MSLKLLFTQSSPLDTTVITETTGHPLYEIETENNKVQKITVVRKLDLGMSNFFLARWRGEIIDEPISLPGRSEENLPRTNEEIARIHWNLIVPDEVIFQGRTMAKDKFVHKVGSGLEEYVVPCVTSHRCS